MANSTANASQAEQAARAALANPNTPARLAYALAAAALLIALISQAFGWEPCELCLWQRYPYYFGLVLAAPAVFWGVEQRWLYAGAAAIFAIGTGVALYHTLVEFDILEGLSSCGASSMATDGSLEEFLRRSETHVTTDCGVRTPYLFGLTMSNLNLVVSLDIASLFAFSALRMGSEPKGQA